MDTERSQECRRLSKQLMRHFYLKAGNEKQICGIGIKELWLISSIQCAGAPGELSKSMQHNKGIKVRVVDGARQFPSFSYRLQDR